MHEQRAPYVMGFYDIASIVEYHMSTRYLTGTGVEQSFQRAVLFFTQALCCVLRLRRAPMMLIHV